MSIDARASGTAEEKPNPGYEARSPDTTWSLPTIVVVRFCFAYYLLYALPWLVSMLPGVDALAEWWYGGQNVVAQWIITNLLGLPQHSPQLPAWYLDHRPDDLAELVACLVCATAAIVVAVLWTATTKKRRPNQRLAYAWLDTLVRFTLAGVMFGYGWSKLFPQQFNGGQVPLPWLLWRLGDFSPAHLVWIFMGYSRPYAVFSGGVEMLGGILVCFRRTATLGALVLVAALTNVVAINLAYDVAVKVSAVNLLLMAVFVAARDTRRLAAAFVQGRAIGRPPMLPPLLAGRRARFAIAAVELLLPLWLLVSPLPRVAANIGGLHFSRAAMPAFGGVFDIATSAGRAAGLKESDGALATWKRVVLTRRSATVLTRNDSIVRYTLAADTTLQRLSLKRSDSDSATMTFRYEIPDSIHVLLRRVDAEATQEVRLRRAEVTLLRWTQRWGW